MNAPDMTESRNMEAGEQTPKARIQRKIYDLLAGGGRYSVAEISARLTLSDPRGHIAAMRRAGYNIADEWKTTEYGNRYKVYWLVK